MKKNFLLTILVVLFTILNQSYNCLAGEKLNSDKLKRIHEHLISNIQKGSIPGAVVLVGQNGRIVFSDAQGYSDIGLKKPLTKDNVFRLASMSKPITGTAILMLAGEGKISLGDPLSKYIPAFKDMKVAVPDKTNGDKQSSGQVLPDLKYTLVPAVREITIRDLLTHSSGIGQGGAGSVEMNKIRRGSGENLAAYIPKLAAAPLDFQPGTRTGYSALAGFDILGRVVEIVSGEPLDQYLSEHLFRLLEMNNTGFAGFKKGVRNRIPVMYKRTDKGLVRDEKEQNTFLDSIYFSGAAGMIGTMEDYYHFARMLADGGIYKGKVILKPEMIKETTSPQLADTIKGFSTGQTWGLSVRVVTSDNGAAAPLPKGCFGWSGAWGTHFWVDPKNRIVALYMTCVSNIGGAGADTARELERDVYSVISDQ